MQENEVQTPVQEEGPWKVFATLGLVFGIVGLVLSFAYGAGMGFAVPGLVFSILGKKSVINGGKAKTGLVLNIIAIALAIIAFIAIVVLIPIIASAASGALDSIYA